MNIDWTEVKVAGLRLLSIMLIGIVAIALLTYWPMVVVGGIVGGCIVHFRQTLTDTVIKPVMKLFGWTNI